MDTPIRMPFMERRLDNLHIQKGPMPNHASTTFGARSFVFLSGGVLIPCASAATACYGQAPGPSHLATEKPPDALYGIYHWVFNPADAQFLINITDASGHIGEADGAPPLSEIVIGTSYNLLRDADGFQMLNVDSSAQPFFKVLSIYPNQALTDFNGLVLCEIVKSIIQA